MKKIQIAVAYHKNSELVENECLLPIQVGKACSDTDLAMLGDDTGNNISGKNFGYAELTAIYWLWKNSKADIKGLFHYRRFLDLNRQSKHWQEDIYEYPLTDKFSSSEFLTQLDISSENIINLLNQYSIITRHREDLYSWSNYSVREHYAAEHHGEHLDKAIEIIQKDWPDYYSSAIKLINGHTSYFTNMFIMDSISYDQYCSWMFDILFKIEPTLNLYDKTLAPNTKKARWAGFLGERLTAIYIQKQIDDGKKVGEFPAVILVPDSTRKWYECNTYDANLYVKNENRKINIKNVEQPNQPIISVCIAAYNVGKFIEKCLSSVVNQTLQDIEIIVVNDGSTDNTLEIIENFAAKDKRIKTITQENSGLGTARKAALRAANGKYIHFLDGDDYLNVAFLEKMVSRAEKYQADMVISNHICFDDNSGEELYRSTLPHTLFGYNLSVKNTPDLLLVPCHLWDKIYLKSLIKDINIPARSSGEDIPFWYEAILAAKSVTILREPLYYYRMNPNSVQSKPENTLNCFNNLKLAETFFIKQNNLFKEYFEIFKHTLIGHMMYRARVALAQNSSFRKEFYECTKYFLNNSSIKLSPKMLKKRDWFYCDFNLMDKIKRCESFGKFEEICSFKSQSKLLLKYMRYSIKKLFVGKQKRERYKQKLREIKSLFIYPIKLKFAGIIWFKLTQKNNKLKIYILGLPVITYKDNNHKRSYYLFGISLFSKTPIKTKLLGFTVRDKTCLFLQKEIDRFCHNSSEQIKNLESSVDKKLSVFLDGQKEISLFDDAFYVKMLQVMCHANAISDTHSKTFGKYKNCHMGQDIVLVATGPSLNKYIPIKDAVHVGVNKAIDFEKIKLDYLFFQDAAVPRNAYIKCINQYPAHKFYGILQDSIRQDWLVNETDTVQADAERYYVISHWYYPPLHFTYDIMHEPLGCAGSVVFSAMQFILWTNPKRIYLVGCDCSEKYFDGTQMDVPANHLVDGWKKLKEFASRYYPETEIISINPVGLKGLFKELYLSQSKEETYE